MDSFAVSSSEVRVTETQTMSCSQFAPSLPLSQLSQGHTLTLLLHSPSFRFLISYPPPHTCPKNLIFLGTITLEISVEEYMHNMELLITQFSTQLLLPSYSTKILIFAFIECH